MEIKVENLELKINDAKEINVEEMSVEEMGIFIGETIEYVYSMFDEVIGDMKYGASERARNLFFEIWTKLEEYHNTAQPKKR